jgi:hypothetical protein
MGHAAHGPITEKSRIAARERECERPSGAIYLIIIPGNDSGRIPGAAQHEVMRCRPGVVPNAGASAVPDLRRNVSRCTASGTQSFPHFFGIIVDW